MTKTIGNLAASIRQKLLNFSKTHHEPFQQVLVNFALERLLYRLSISNYSDRFVLKGALLFRLWFDLPQRPTRDIDFLGFGEADPEQIKTIFAQLIEIDAEDGLIFSTESITAEPIRKAAGYPGIRVQLQASLDNARIPIQCDIGFGDAITSSAVSSEFPTLLDLPAPVLRAYPLETVVAEKLEALIKLARFNTRLKDYFDLWVLSTAEQIDHAVLPKAIATTFKRRQTSLPTTIPVGLTKSYATEKAQQWNAFLKRSKLEAPPLDEVVKELAAIYWPLLEKSNHH
ncbi:MAG TPA: nucleotidyl transferase AbiEii/AbiGii toxin family protein [Cellvibrionaceae bacterium]|nr:nucleotidyl transferase AbiEii/AbiGii toxin family protein [Cellvibrionaceae bacterium]HMW48796.1 nucleotidyl transferase AbiEii/AbiGii toxin family protein [Cellvibrionaceae bacterium]HMW70347.1 nucleotidyl transferase AbiEii/AbiGii toxin family protein [Cellvibrionaceae bacterium]HMY39244.1 nucleotidyl transferase AbiEii/AbiGii toxin family protein [Marinagarivorans sp.]HNG58406.1 nucleotidyl transferase AbiEii/AbiGii toxin family protein [Cellvibrionaceae bacterium]